VPALSIKKSAVGKKLVAASEVIYHRHKIAKENCGSFVRLFIITGETNV